jgi:proteasome activator subunit 4
MKYSEKPSIVALMDSIQDLLIGLFSSFEIEFQFPDNSIMKRANKLLENYEGCVHLRYPGLDCMSDAEAREVEIKRNQENLSCYYDLCNKLVELANDKSLHWRHTEMAQSLLSLLLRRDIEYPKAAVLIFECLLASDVIKARKTAVNIMSSWLRINKPKAIRQVLDFDKGENQPGAKWPIKYGIRGDNVGLLFKQEDKITTAEQWNNTLFHTKPYIGFYIWPKEYRIYATPNQQVHLNRDQSAFSDTEKELITLLTEPTHLARILELMAVEEKKGSEEFNSSSYSLFYGLTRSFGTVIVEAFRPFVEELLANKKESSQRLAAELVAGIIKGSKLWTYDKVKPLQDWLGPLLMTNFETINVEIEQIWAQALSNIFFDSEPRQTAWLFDILMELWAKPTENTYHTAARLYYIHCAANQWQWRNLEIWNKLFEICKSMLGNSLQNLRTRVAS